MAGVSLPRHQVPLHKEVFTEGWPRHPPASGLGDWQEAASPSETGQRTKVFRVFITVLNPQTQTQLQVLWSGKFKPSFFKFHTYIHIL